MKTPTHVYVAVRLLDRIGVDEAVTGDLLEVYDRQRSAVRLWREASIAAAATIARRLRDNKPQSIRRAATLAAAAGVLGYSLALPGTVDVGSSVRVEALSGGWFETDTPSGRTRLVPTVSFQLKNVSDATVPSVQINILFRRITDSHEWSDVFRRAITSRGLLSGSTTEPITVLSSAGYTGDEPTARLLQHSQFVDTAVSIYARHGSGDWTCLGEYPIPREIVRRHFGPSDVEHVTTGLRLR